MKEYIIDGNEFSTYNEAYIKVREVISNNTEKDAITIRDLVLKYVEEPTKFIWKNAEKSKEDLGYTETVFFLKRKLQSVPLHELVSTLNEIRNAENKQGPTLFDKVLDALTIDNLEIILK